MYIPRGHPCTFLGIVGTRAVALDNTSVWGAVYNVIILHYALLYCATENTAASHEHAMKVYRSNMNSLQLLLSLAKLVSMLALGPKCFSL